MAVSQELKQKVHGREYSPAFEKLMAKVGEPCDLRCPQDPPRWLDKDLFHSGIDFFWNNFFTVVFSSIMNLLVGISIPNLW